MRATGTVSRAVRPAIHDVTDASALRSWFNPPLAASLSDELYKAQNIVAAFARVGALFPERSVPAAVLDGAAGFAVLSVLKVGPLAVKVDRLRFCREHVFHFARQSSELAMDIGCCSRL